MRAPVWLTAAIVACGLATNGSAPAQQAAKAVPTATAAAPATPSPVPVEQERALPSLAPLIESVKGAVVNVDVKKRVEAAQLRFGDELFERFFRMPAPRMPQESPVRRGAGSGFIIRADGLVLTNNHVVEGADDILVKLDDGREFSAKVLGTDPLTDLALLKLQGKVENLPVVRLGDSDALKVGDWVVAIGNPFGLASSVSAGIISAKERDIRAGPYDDFLQTDAAINPGNSGGPLFNLRGEVIGINTAIIGGGTGIGFAVPSNMAKALLPQLEKGEVRRGWLGVSIQDLTPDLAKALKVPVPHGAVVIDVNEGTPAKKAGLKADDVIVSVDGQPVESSKDLSRRVGFMRPGGTVVLGVYRDSRKMDLRVELGLRPDLEGVGKRFGGGRDDRAERLGLAFQDVEPGSGKTGALITHVEPGTPADRADLRPGMVVVGVDGQKVHGARDVARILSSARSGSTVLIRVEVDGARLLRAISIP